MENKTLLSPSPEQGLSEKKASELEMRSSTQCPICGQNDVADYIHAPDRLHGRQQEYSLVRCANCSLVWLHDPPKPEDMGAHYTAAYDRFIAGAGEHAEARWRGRQANLTKYKQAGALLDLGCSSGSFLGSMRGDSWKLFGIEMSRESAKVAEAKTGAEVFVGEILDAPFKSDMFDVITCFDVLEHLYEPQRVMKKVADWLKPGGIFYVQVPNIDSAEARVFGRYWQGLELPRHLFHYSPKSLRTLGSMAGLSEVSIVAERNQTIETSMRYLVDNGARKMGITRTALVNSGKPGLPWRACRKLMRMTVLKVCVALLPAVGSGEAIHGIFRKGDR